MPTRDGKYFGKAEIEWVYDFMAEHKDMGLGETIHAVIEKFDLPVDEATNYVTFCRKERRQMIMERADIKHFCESLVEKSGTAIMRDNLIKIVKDGWNIDRDKAAEYIDAAIDEIKDPQKRLIFYDDWESLSAALTKKVGTIEPAAFPQPIDRDGVGHYETAEKSWTPVEFASPGIGERIKGERSWTVGSPVEKRKGYRFPGEVISEFRTRKGKLRYVVEGIGDGNSECLHIFSAEDLCEMDGANGWVYRINGQWRYSLDTFPDNAEHLSIRPATEAEKSFWKRA